MAWGYDRYPGNNQLLKGKGLKQKTRQTMGGFFHAVGFG
jgi:hypothetical protein